MVETENDSATSSQTQSNNYVKERPNNNLLKLGKLANVSNNSLQQTLQSAINGVVENKETSYSDTKIGPELPPPSYESVVKTISENNSPTIPSSSHLPSYRDVAGLADAPPTYHSIFADTVLSVFNPFTNDENNDQENPSVNVDVVHHSSKIASVLLNVTLFVFLITFILILPISMLVVGIVYVRQCPVQPRIPIYLIVLGFFQMLECCGRLGYKIFQNQNGRTQNTWRERYRRKDPLVYFMIVWFVIGSMWVYQTNPDCKDCNPVLRKHNSTTFNSTSHLFTTQTTKYLPVSYCNKTVYNFAFWVITMYYSTIGIFCFLILIDVVMRAITKCCCRR